MILAGTSVWVNHFRRDDPHLRRSLLAGQILDEVLGFLDRHQLFGKGISWIDAHLLASARLSACRLWTLDLRLSAAANRLHLGYSATN